MAEESKASAGVPDATVFGEATACVYELVAFPNRGSAEAVRLLFALTNTPFRDQTITQKKAAKYKKTLKLGRLPVLFDDSTCTEIGSIRAMLQHIARKKKAAGGTDGERATVDSVFEIVGVLNTAVRAVVYTRDIDTLAVAKLFHHGGVVETFLNQAQALLNKSSFSFTPSAGPSVADVLVFDALDVLTQLRPNCLARHPALQKAMKVVSQIPTVAAYLAKRRPGDFTDKGSNPLPTNNPVCVTGANGYIASHLVQQLLARGYTVRGTVRGMSKAGKVDHLRALPGADERLELFEADLLVDGAFNDVVKGCKVVHHTASPFFFAKERDAVVEPALKGTKNVLNACVAANVKRVILTSSTAAMYGYAMPPGHVLQETDWSDLEWCDSQKNYYFASKTLAEKAAWEIAETAPFKLVVMNPTLVIGPCLQSNLNTSIEVFVKRVKEDDFTNCNLVDVRDVALAHILGAEKSKAEGRHLLMAATGPAKEFASHFWKHVPEELAAAHAPEGTNDTPSLPVCFSCEKARKGLGLRLMPVEVSIADTARSVVARGFLE